jgi:hypothetical protein
LQSEPLGTPNGLTGGSYQGIIRLTFLQNFYEVQPSETHFEARQKAVVTVEIENEPMTMALLAHIKELSQSLHPAALHPNL